MTTTIRSTRSGSPLAVAARAEGIALATQADHGVAPLFARDHARWIELGHAASAWTRLRDWSESLWYAAGDDPDPARAHRAAADASRADDLWDEAADDDLSIGERMAAMESARQLAADWGDDASERAALLLLAAEVLS